MPKTEIEADASPIIGIMIKVTITEIDQNGLQSKKVIPTTPPNRGVFGGVGSITFFDWRSFNPSNVIRVEN